MLSTLRTLILSFLFGAVAFTSGCASASIPREERYPAPSSSYTKAVIQADAIRWALLGEKGRTWSPLAPTGSMAPFLDSRSIALYEPYVGQPLHVGDWIVFDRGDVSNVLHRIEDVRGDCVFISGVNVPRSDGWFPKSKIKLRVVGVLYSTR